MGLGALAPSGVQGQSPWPFLILSNHRPPSGARALYRKLLLPLSETLAGEAALRLGLDLARLWRAHLAAVIVRVDSRGVAPLAGEGLSGAMIEDMMQATERESGARVATLTARFERMVAEAGIAVNAAPGLADEPTAALEILVGREEGLVPCLAQAADLTVLPHPSDDPDGTGADRLHAVLFDSGRPVLIAPPVVPASLGRRCCVAWNGSTEGSAALAAMMPWLRRAESVRVVYAAEYQRSGLPAESLQAYFALHGVAAEFVPFQPVNRNVAAGLLAAAAAFDADLLGMGAYSHSRLRQLILGGVTRHVLGHARMPVLMSR